MTGPPNIQVVVVTRVATNEKDPTNRNNDNNKGHNKANPLILLAPPNHGILTLSDITVITLSHAFSFIFSPLSKASKVASTSSHAQRH
jgi:hypothetical protein